jgi:hypothetical protein
MKKLIALAALAFALGRIHQASACDMGAITTYVAGATGEQTTQQAATDAKLAPAAPKVATDKPLASPITVADCTNGNC